MRPPRWRAGTATAPCACWSTTADRSALLIERCEPGTHLRELEPGDNALGVMIGLLPRLWKPVAAAFASLADEAVHWLEELPPTYERAGRPSPYGSLFCSLGFAAMPPPGLHPDRCGGSGGVFGVVGVAFGTGGDPEHKRDSADFDMARYQPDLRDQGVVRMPHRRGDPNPSGNSRSSNSYPNIPLTHHPVLRSQIHLPRVQKTWWASPKKRPRLD